MIQFVSGIRRARKPQASIGSEGTVMSDESLADRVEKWMVGQMPIIQMHGGTSVVREADAETGEVVVELGGTTWCGAVSRTSPPTTSAAT